MKPDEIKVNSRYVNIYIGIIVTCTGILNDRVYVQYTDKESLLREFGTKEGATYYKKHDSYSLTEFMAYYQIYNS